MTSGQSLGELMKRQRHKRFTTTSCWIDLSFSVKTLAMFYLQKQKRTRSLSRALPSINGLCITPKFLHIVASPAVGCRPLHHLCGGKLRPASCKRSKTSMTLLFSKPRAAMVLLWFITFVICSSPSTTSLSIGSSTVNRCAARVSSSNDGGTKTSDLVSLAHVSSGYAHVTIASAVIPVPSTTEPRSSGWGYIASTGPSARYIPSLGVVDLTRR